MRRWAGVRQASFARASEHPYRRRTTDVFRVVVATVGVIWLSDNSGYNSPLSLAVFHALNGLPGALKPLFENVYRASAIWALLIVAAAAVVTRRWRLARDLLLAGVLGWLLARGLGPGARRRVPPRPARASSGRGSRRAFPTSSCRCWSRSSPRPSPYLTRAVRWFDTAVVALLIPTELYLGVALPRSVATALILGLGRGRGHPPALRLAGRPADAGPGRVGAARPRGGRRVDVRLAPVQPSEHTVMHANDGTAGLVVKVLGRDERDARLVTKVWKFLYYKDSGPTLYLTRIQEIEHQAYLTLLARNGGVRVPPVVVAGTGGPGTVLMAERDVGGRAVSDLEAAEIDDALLADIWAQAAQLHHIRIAHGRLNTGQLRATPEGVTIVGFAYASASASEELRTGGRGRAAHDDGEPGRRRAGGTGGDRRARPRRGHRGAAVAPVVGAEPRGPPHRRRQPQAARGRT